MDIAQETQLRTEFRNILYDLAKRQDVLQEESACTEIYSRLERLYYAKKGEEGFRHFYSDVFAVLTSIQLDPTLGDIAVLSENLRWVYENYKAERKDENGIIINVSGKIKKLYDHVNLDVARISYSDAADRKVSGEEAISSLQAQMTIISSNIEKTKEEQKDIANELKKQQSEYKVMADELKNQQREYIAILGIFAAIVLAFTGGIAFSTSVLENINTVSIYRIALIALVIGLILVNILFGLFYYINRLVNGKTEKEIMPLYVSNAIIVALIVALLAAWYFGWVEGRNAKVHSNEVAISISYNAMV